MPGVEAVLGRRAGELPHPSQQESDSRSSRSGGERGERRRRRGSVAPAVSERGAVKRVSGDRSVYASGPACPFPSQRMAMVLLAAAVVFMNDL